MTDDASLLFLGSGGGRGALLSGLRRTAGFLLLHRGTSIVVDPGLGAHAGLLAAGVDPHSLDAIVISHFHLDHVVEANLLLEGMTLTGTRGLLAAPEQALEGRDRVVYMYRRPHLRSLVTLTEEPFSVGGVRVEPHGYRHGNADTFRFLFRLGDATVAFFSDGASLAGADAMAGADVAVLNCLLPMPVAGIDHLDPGLCVEILRRCRPRKAFLTHFAGGAIKRGLTLEMAARVEAGSGVPCTAATDMMEVGL
ncbi:MBL fold metallo-hydrolase [bacterium]|nr:MBL fold metallo-hydrolase [bacterium]